MAAIITDPKAVTKNTVVSTLDPGGFFGNFYNKKSKSDNVAGSSYYSFSDDAANALGQKDQGFVDEWRRNGGNRTFSQWLKDWAVGAQSSSSDPNDKKIATDTLNWLKGYDQYGMDPDVAKQQIAAEQGLSDYVMNNYIYPDLNADQQRSQTAQQIISNYSPQFDAVRQQIADLYPTTDGGHSKLLDEQLGYNTEVTNDQLAALKTQLVTNTSSLATQIDSLKANLGVELGAKAEALKQQLATLTSGIDTLTSAQRAALAQQLATNYQSLEAEVAAKQQNLSTELASLGSAVDAQSQARKAALQTELDKLNAAQAPLNAVREQGAQTLATSVNLGVESKQDAVLADMAQQGYVGGSSGTDASLARAAISGRQEAAKALADARTLNASDLNKIAQYGATEGYGIDSDQAQAVYDLSKYGANQQRTLSDYNANQNRTLTDYGASEGRTITNNDATNRFNLNTQKANSEADLANYGAEQNRAVSDYGTNATKQLSDYGASETRNINDTSAQRKLNYFDQDIARRLSSLALPEQAVQAEFQIRNMADEYGQSGLQRAYKNLGFFDTSGNSSAPNTQAYTGYTGTDSGFENLGAGLVSLAGSMGNANKWWSTPTAQTTTTMPTTTKVNTTPVSFNGDYGQNGTTTTPASSL